MAAPPSDAWVQVLGTIVGAVVGGLGAYWGGLVARRAEANARREQQAADYQLRTWMELQDALEGLDNAIGREVETLKLERGLNGSKAVVSSTQYFAEATLRTQILGARLLDHQLISLTKTAITHGREAM